MYDDPKYIEIILELRDKLKNFFNVFVDKKYDLWNNGTAKGSVQRPWVWQHIYGDDWKPTTEVFPEFSEDTM